jgi:uncharacterized protein involved in exopolysaccharide biosynthesis
MKSQATGQLNGRDQVGANDEISIVEVLTIILRYRRPLVAIALSCATLFGVWRMAQPPMYTASASFIPQAPQRGASGAAALARQFGVATGGLEQPGQSPQFYAELVRSREILSQAATARYAVDTAERGAETRTLVELYEVRGDHDLKTVVERLRSEVSSSVGRETGIVEVRVAAPNPMLAEQIADRLIELLNKFNLETRQSQASEERRFIAERLDDSRSELADAEAELKHFLQQNRQFRNSPELTFEHERLQRVVAMRQEVVSSLTQAHEQARIDAVRDTPVLTLVAGAEGSAFPHRRGIALRVISGFLFGLVFGLFLVFSLEFSRRSKASDRNEHREFQRLRRETWADLRRPWRVVSSATRQDNTG